MVDLTIVDEWIGLKRKSNKTEEVTRDEYRKLKVETVWRIEDPSKFDKYAHKQSVILDEIQQSQSNSLFIYSFIHLFILGRFERADIQTMNFEDEDVKSFIEREKMNENANEVFLFHGTIPKFLPKIKVFSISILFPFSMFSI